MGNISKDWNFVTYCGVMAEYTVFKELTAHIDQKLLMRVKHTDLMSIGEIIEDFSKLLKNELLYNEFMKTKECERGCSDFIWKIKLTTEENVLGEEAAAAKLSLIGVFSKEKTRQNCVDEGNFQNICCV